MTTDSIFGHQQIQSQLYNAIETGRIAGAYLFVGMEGLGKEKVALDFAQSINCLDYQHNAPSSQEKRGACQQCLSCKKTIAGNHPDFAITRPDGSNIKIDQIRSIQSQIVFRPLEGKRKVYLLTEVEKMNLEAANCLLKTLEEPPAESTLILVANNMDALLPTIRSRCQILSFQPMEVRDLAKILVNQFDLDLGKAMVVSARTQGAIGKAFSICQTKEAIEVDQVPEILTTLDRLSAFRIAEDISETPEMLDQLLTWYRDLLLIHQQVNPQLLTHQQNFSQLKKIVRNYSRIQLQKAIEIILETKNRINRNVNTNLAIEVMVFNILPRPNVTNNP